MQIQIQILMKILIPLTQTQAPRQKVHFYQESNQPLWISSLFTESLSSFLFILGRNELFRSSQHGSDQVYDQDWSRCLPDWLLVSCGPSWQGDPRPWESPGLFSQDYDEHDYDEHPPPLGESRSSMLISFSHDYDEHYYEKDPLGSLMLIVCSRTKSWCWTWLR